MKLRFVFLLLGLLLVGFVLFCNWVVNRTSAAYLYSEASLVPHHRVGLVLGTSEKLGSGKPNPYFAYRIAAAVELYKSGRVDYLLLSGDNSQKNYNEPEDMKAALVAQGVPAGKIYLDFAGFRTLDSVVRAREIFGQDSFVVISQRFHNQRAVFLARQKGIDAIAYNALDVYGSDGTWTHAREMLARVKVFVDLYLGKEPHFLGEKIKIG
jgi:SanA protein